MRVGIIQSNYIPWRGYFEFISKCDLFIFLDDVQYTRRDWRNRNRIRTNRGDVWLTIPLKQDDFHAKISEMQVSDPIWDRRHFDTIRAAYRTAKCWNQFEDELEWAYIDAPTDLSGINRHFVELGMKWLGITTPLKRDTELLPSYTGDATGRLISLCRKSGATSYLSGPAAKDYLNEKAFQDAGIKVEWMEYGNWPRLSFIHGVLNGLEAR